MIGIRERRIERGNAEVDKEIKFKDDIEYLQNSCIFFLKNCFEICYHWTV